MEKPSSALEFMAPKAALLSVTEIGLGSFIHAFKIPLGGHFLSLNQGFFLSRWHLQKSDASWMSTSPATLSSVVALLKTLSPAGKKLTPMLAIAAQGLLFNLGTLLARSHAIGHFMGMTALCLWGFIQPVLIYLLLFGRTLLEVANYFAEKLSELGHFPIHYLWWMLGALIGVKVFLGWILVMLAMTLSENKVLSYEKSLSGWAQRRPQPIERSLGGQLKRDLLRPLFLFSWILTALFFWMAEHSWSQITWALLRPLAISVCLAYLWRIFPWEKFVTPKKEKKSVGVISIMMKVREQMIQRGY